MGTHEKIRLMREVRQWSQEEMAEKLNMSPSGYAKIERGETKLYLDKLEKIAQILDIDLIELIQSSEKNICFLISENSQLSSNYYANNDASIENEKLKLIISHKEQILEQKDNEIKSLREIIELLKLQTKSDNK
ncbi:helix-turn-helix protein [Bisgaardia hudsonensis]|uniref:Helix-turn-helix protein n=1 Tax=Bisgaardia hudsonensis TaxID=109472 RepID=A0A4R2MVC1_9PAST|nr:helix-turn-helix transcriptional regulator [Bisgaardia hudsonensis]QLB12183.1 transcriptional regulator [Bisgaardia hudsonensis]TCP12221.1 helix-turn-helix protein [Bisgaardia hudsonensis]